MTLRWALVDRIQYEYLRVQFDPQESERIVALGEHEATRVPTDEMAGATYRTLITW